MTNNIPDFTQVACSYYRTDTCYGKEIEIKLAGTEMQNKQINKNRNGKVGCPVVFRCLQGASFIV